jgi:ATP-dependent exoDNAse (exonuclease V) alpha subunit
VSRNEEKSFDDVIRLFSTKDEVQQYNNFKLMNMKDGDGNLVPIARVPAKHQGSKASTVSAEKANGLESVLYLARGTRIMLRTNLWVKKGLVNGAMGSVVDILYVNGNEPSNDAPSILMCKFDNYYGPGIGPDNLVPIAPVVKTFTNSNGDQCSRQQFPVVVCYGCSIHKSQGLTLSKVKLMCAEFESYVF